MVTKEAADEAISAHLKLMEREMDNFGSALPENKDRPPHRLAVSRVDEYDFGWVYFWNSKRFIETGEIQYALVGNAPIIVDRSDGKLYWTGTSRRTEFYVEEFRSGNRSPVSPSGRSSSAA